MKMPWSKASALNAGRRSTRTQGADVRSSARMPVALLGRTNTRSRRTGNRHALPCARSVGRSSWQAGSIKAKGNIAATPVPTVAGPKTQSKNHNEVYEMKFANKTHKSGCLYREGFSWGILLTSHFRNHGRDIFF